MTDYPPLRVGAWFQGPTGSGQGGWTAQRFAAAISERVTIAIRAAIPLETDLAIVRHLTEAGSTWHLVDPAVPEQPILIATPWVEPCAATTPVSITDAANASTRFPLHDDHPVPACFSCGHAPDSMHAQAGPLPDGRWATDWTVPDWASSSDGVVDVGALWAAIDCTQGWYAGIAGGRRPSLTVQIAVETLLPLEPGATYALVAWQGNYEPDWDGRKRGAGGAAFAVDGSCVARSTTFWVATE